MKIDFSKSRFRERAVKYYDEGNYLSALRFAYKEINLYGGDGDAYMMISDIYENMELYSISTRDWRSIISIWETRRSPRSTIIN